MQKSGVHIREAGRHEAGLVATLSRETFLETFGPLNTQENIDQFMNRQFAREQLEAEVDAPGNLFLLAWEGAYPVGYVRLTDRTAPATIQHKRAIEIARFYVRQSHVGQGIGKQLMDHALACAAQQQKEVVWLGVWEENKSAIGFYQKQGFEKIGEHIFMLGNDPQNDWLMKKDL